MYARMKLKKVWLFAAAALMTASCKDYDESVVSNEPVSVELAYTLSSSASGIQTRQADEVVVPNTATPRMPRYMRLIPLISDWPQLSDISWETPVSKPGDAARTTSLLYHTYRCYLSPDVNGFLVYGNVANKTAPAGTDNKMYNGWLNENFPPVITQKTDLDNISFSLEPIYKSETNGTPEGATTLANYLTAITQTDGWNSSTNDFMKNLLKKFTNDGISLPGSAASVKKWIEALITSIDYYLDPANTPAGVGEAEKTALTHIKEAANTQISAIGEINATCYPRNLSLPDGAAVLRWADVVEGGQTIKKFIPQMQTTTLANINSLSRFAYPAPLYYFVTSTIKTSDKKIDFSTLYQDVVATSEKTEWDLITEKEEFSNDHVTLNTKAVAITKPVQYAVAQLSVKIKAFSDALPDASTPVKNISVGTNKFPLKGIIVCNQRPVDYKFEQETIEHGSTSDANVLFIYDNQVKSGCYLTTTADNTWKEGCNTLVLQSQMGEDVNIILEFENNSDEDFTCVDGIVYRGTRFYLIGKVEAARYNPSESNINSENNKQIFTKDYITTVNMTVSSLAKAYNVPPNLLSNNLEIGVETTPQWVAAQPTVIRLE